MTYNKNTNQTTKEKTMNTSYYSKLTLKKSPSQDAVIDANDLHSNDDTHTLVEIFRNLSLEDIECVESIKIEKYVKKARAKWGEYKGSIQFDLVDGGFVESQKSHIPALKRHIKIIEQINEIIAAKKAAKEQSSSAASSQASDWKDEAIRKAVQNDVFNHKDFNSATNTDHARASKVMLEELRADLREVELDMFASKPAILDMYQDNVKKFDGTDCKIAQEYAEMIRSLIEKNRPQEESQDETKHFYDFVGYMLGEGHVDTTQDTQDTINDLVIEYVDECKNSGYDLPVSLHYEIDRWHVANMIQSHLNLEARYYRERLEKMQKTLRALKEI